MKARFLSCWLTVLALVTAGHAQGTFVYDQESSSDETALTGAAHIQFYSSVGQSFTPSLSTVSFVRLRLYDINPGNSLGATLVVNLRSTSMSGPIMGTTTVVLPDGYGYIGATNFLFATPVSVIPNTTYFFETLVQSGDSWGILSTPNTYPSGTFYSGGTGTSFPGNDIWFREGIIVPEPSALTLLCAGLAAVWFARSKRRS
jgi:hypothetical protein